MNNSVQAVAKIKEVIAQTGVSLEHVDEMLTHLRALLDYVEAKGWAQDETFSRQLHGALVTAVEVSVSLRMLTQHQHKLMDAMFGKQSEDLQ